MSKRELTPEEMKEAGELAVKNRWLVFKVWDELWSTYTFAVPTKQRLEDICLSAFFIGAMHWIRRGRPGKYSTFAVKHGLWAVKEEAYFLRAKVSDKAWTGRRLKKKKLSEQPFVAPHYDYRHVCRRPGRAIPGTANNWTERSRIEFGMQDIPVPDDITGLLERDLLNKVTSVVEDLPEVEKDIVKTYLGLECEPVTTWTVLAEARNMSTYKVKAAYERAMKKLREQLGVASAT